MPENSYKGSYIPRIGINGFGRIGRLVVRAAFNSPGRVNIVAINNASTDIEQMVYALKYDSAHGRWEKEVSLSESNPKKLIIDGHEIVILSNRDPKNLNWKDHQIDWVIEATGCFNSIEKANEHRHENGCNGVLISAPSPDAPTFVMGVNNLKYDPQLHNSVISNASCTTNCLSPLAKVINDNFGIQEAFVSTIHAMTAKQKVVDSPAKSGNWRTARCGVANIIPTSTGAAKAIEKVIPELSGKFTGMAFRIPTYDVSVVDFTVKTVKETSIDEINDIIKKAIRTDEYRGILDYNDAPLVSTDFLKNSNSSIYDGDASMALNSTFFKLIAWYDNEYGYSMRCVDMVHYCANKQKGTLF